MSEAPRYDVVVVGGGSAGCTVAGRLAEDPALRVLLLEAGDPADAHPETLSADGYKDAFVNDALLHERFSVPQAGCGGRRLYLGTGRGMGGSGAINAMVYTRGAAADFEEWPAGWRWGDLAPDFAALEATLGVRPRPPTRFTETCIRAAAAAGFRPTDDLNGGDLHGVLGHETMSYAGDRRRSSYVAFVRDRRAPNLDVWTGATVARVVLDAERRAVGVDVERGGRSERVGLREGGEVVLCAGALESPKVLLLSGVGPAAELRAAGVDVHLDRPGVGANLHDHPNVTLFFLGREVVDAHYPQLYGFHRANPASALPAGQPDTCYVFYPARSSMKQMAQRMLPALVLPPRLYAASAPKRLLRGAVAAGFAAAPVRRLVERLYGLVVILGKPRSRGTLRLQGRDPRAPALLDPRYLSHPEDLATLVEGVRLARRIAGTPPLAAWGNRELAPGFAATQHERLVAWIRGALMTTFHFAGTCRMGEDAGAVLDPWLRVRGVQGLRVADAAAMPTTPVAALNAPSMLLGWRAASLVREARADAALRRPTARTAAQSA